MPGHERASSDAHVHTLHIPKVELAGLLANEHGFDARIFDREQAALAWLRYGER